MLTNCPECKSQVSDKAAACPHCGYPLTAVSCSRSRRKSNKRRRLPNGFGSITEIKGHNLRNPFYVRTTVGKNEYGRPILQSLKPQCYFATYNEAYAALLERHKNPYDLDSDMTVKELYEKWSSEYYEKISHQAVRTIQSAWAYCSSIENMKVRNVRARHIKGCMEDGYRIETRGQRIGEKIYASSGTKARIKSMFNLMLDYALEYELCDRNYARTFDVSDDIQKECQNMKRGHIIFTEDELNLLWQNVKQVKYVDWILIQCYMGWRPQELATLKLDEVNINEWYIQAGMKTDAGKQRIVPIHEKIKELVRSNYKYAVSISSEYLFNEPGETYKRSTRLTYDKYRHRFNNVLKELNMNPEHRPHDPRMTFITRCKKAGVDEFAIKEMVGHTIKDITESVYTVRDLEWLRKDLSKLQ